MNTKVLSYPEYKDLDFKPEHLFVKLSNADINEMIDDEMKRIAKRYGKVVDTDAEYEIAVDDIVMIRSKSSLAKYNKPMIPVTVGKNLFSEIIENNLIGMKVKESKVVNVDGEDVEFTVLKVKTREVPEITLDMLKEDLKNSSADKAVIKAVKSIDDFKNILREDFIDMNKMENFFDNVYKYIRDLAISKMEVDLDEEDYNVYRENFMYGIKSEAMNEGMDFVKFLFTLFDNSDELTEENIMEKVEENIRRDFMFKLFADAISEDISDKDLKKAYKEMVKEYSSASNTSEDEIMNQFSFDDFKSQSSVMNVQNKIFEKYMSEVKVVAE